MAFRSAWWIFLAVLVAMGVPARAEKPVEIKYSRQELEGKWRARIRSFLDKGVIPIIDLESSLKRLDGEGYLAAAIEVMDELGVALIAFDGYQAKKKNKKKKRPPVGLLHP